ncbi:unnamed protein product [Symbiodinium necroappetens]|uniref:Uncharacterized protein n=1 Tax=Symbiodinium necroappetens TaxID=1628268 RepID=A0A812XGC6_9DINO|nr:unnamed protein product [Symbiodinium necroappetens]
MSRVTREAFCSSSRKRRSSCRGCIAPMPIVMRMARTATGEVVMAQVAKDCQVLSVPEHGCGGKDLGRLLLLTAQNRHRPKCPKP